MAIPEIEPSQRESAAAWYAESGATIYRGAVPPDIVDELYLLCSAVFAILDLKVQERQHKTARPDDPLAGHVDLYGKHQFVGDDVARTVLSGAYLGQAGFDKICATVKPIVEASLGKPLSFVPGKSAFRRQGTQEHARRSAFVP
jgi:hypothetical protein